MRSSTLRPRPAAEALHIVSSWGSAGGQMQVSAACTMRCPKKNPARLPTRGCPLMNHGELSLPLQIGVEQPMRLIAPCRQTAKCRRHMRFDTGQGTRFGTRNGSPCDKSFESICSQEHLRVARFFRLHGLSRRKALPIGPVISTLRRAPARVLASLVQENASNTRCHRSHVQKPLALFTTESTSWRFLFWEL